MNDKRRVVGFMKILFGNDIAKFVRNAEDPCLCAAGLYFRLRHRFIPDILYKGNKHWCLDIFYLRINHVGIIIYSKVKVKHGRYRYKISHVEVV